MNYTNPYLNSYYGGPYYSNPYLNQNAQAPRNPQSTQIPTQQYNTFGLQGKTVDSVDVVKATDIPLDGSVSYFPFVDGSAIATKNIQPDGTSKITVYKPMPEETDVPQPKYVTESDLKKEIGKIDFSEFNDKFKEIDRKIEDLSDDIKKISKKG